MAITTYAELKTAIQDYGKRTDALSMLDTFIDLAESDIWDSLRIRDMEARATASSSTSDRFLALPDGFIKMRRLHIEMADGTHIPLEYVDPSNLSISISAGRPAQFTVGTQIEFNRTSDQAYTVEMKYWKELTALSSSNTTNAVLTDHPMLYLAACMRHFYVWALDLEKGMFWDTVYEQQVARANRKSRKGRYGPAPAKTVPGMVI